MTDLWQRVQSVGRYRPLQTEAFRNRIDQIKRRMGAASLSRLARRIGVPVSWLRWIYRYRTNVVDSENFKRLCMETGENPDELMGLMEQVDHDVLDFLYQHPEIVETLRELMEKMGFVPSRRLSVRLKKRGARPRVPPSWRRYFQMGYRTARARLDKKRLSSGGS